MRAVETVMEYYVQYGKDTAGCAASYLKNRAGKDDTRRKIKKIAIYYPVMNRGGVQRVISLLLPIYGRLHYDVILITEQISDEDYEIPEWVKRFVITSERQALSDQGSFCNRYQELENILDTELVDLFFHHGVRQELFVYDVILSKTAGVYTLAEKHQVFTQGFCDMKDLFWVQLPAFQVIDGLVVLSTAEETYWKTFGINAFYIENPMNERLKIEDCSGQKDCISWAGRLDIYSKQYFDVLKVAAIVKKTHPEVRFRMFGSGSKAKIRELTECIERYGLKDDVIFYGYETNVVQMYRNTRIQLVTSAYEGFPMVVYESKMLGIPMVLYDLPYLELLRNGLGYLSAPSGDIRGIAENICRILDHPELEAALSREAKSSLQDFSNEAVARKWRLLFHNIEEHILREDGINAQYGMILKTMHRHYAVAQRKYEKLLWDSEQAVLAYHVRKEMKKGKKPVICPYGTVGKRVKGMLNEKGIQEAYIVDNGLSQKGQGILSLADLKEMDCGEYLFIVCCEDGDLKEWFRNQLRKITGTDNILYYDAALEGES